MDEEAEVDVTVTPAMLQQDVVRLNLGCNRNALEGWTNVDLVNFKGVDVRTNLDARWPWEDGSVDYIRAYDLVEHLRSNIHTMNEAWRVLRIGGTLEILVPSTDGRGAFQDPTHISWWNVNTFYYFAVIQEDDQYRSHHLRRIYAPHLIKAAFEVHLDESGPTEDGVIYIGAKCIKVPDPGDCEAPDECDEPGVRDEG
jgi:predicted SAM-dependent methyltransferase